MPKGLQTRGQAQHHHAQVAAESQQHLAHIFGLHLRAQGCVVRPLSVRLSRSRQALHMDQVVGLNRQLRQLGAKSLANHLFGFVQVRAGVDQITGGLHGDRATNVGQDERHRVSVGQDVFARLKRFTRNQRFGKSAGLGQSSGQLLLCCGQHDGRHIGRMGRKRCGTMQTTRRRHGAGGMADGGTDHKFSDSIKNRRPLEFGHPRLTLARGQNQAKFRARHEDHAASSPERSLASTSPSLVPE